MIPERVGTPEIAERFNGRAGLPFDSRVHGTEDVSQRYKPYRSWTSAHEYNRQRWTDGVSAVSYWIGVAWSAEGQQEGSSANQRSVPRARRVRNRTIQRVLLPRVSVGSGIRSRPTRDSSHCICFGEA